jgi:hypothetical protein
MWSALLASNNKQYVQADGFGRNAYAEMCLMGLAPLAMAFPTLAEGTMHGTSVSANLVEEGNGFRRLSLICNRNNSLAIAEDLFQFPVVVRELSDFFVFSLRKANLDPC